MSNTVTGAQDVAAAQEQGISSVQSRAWSKQDNTWVISLFGTAVGAGILFLPINAGMGGFWPLVVMALLVGPMTYLAHRGLARFVLSSKQPNADITQVVEEHFGVGAGKLITLLYFFAIYPIVLIYGVGITNTVESFLVNQLQMTPPPRWILSIVLIMAMMSVMLAGEKLMLKVTEFLVYPLIAILAGISEPALYGVAVRLKRPLIASLISGFICGAVAGIAGLASHSMAAPGLFTSVQFFDPANPMSIVWVFGVMALAVVLSFVLTLLLGFEDIPVEEAAADARARQTTTRPSHV